MKGKGGMGGSGGTRDAKRRRAGGGEAEAEDLARAGITYGSDSPLNASLTTASPLGRRLISSGRASKHCGWRSATPAAARATGTSGRSVFAMLHSQSLSANVNLVKSTQAAKHRS
ncbi:unnamed protein product [Prorocentrum cordatum]|uniref:Uncharacterized protein n=1 Tax=Prorocentrum cordatum TaxID=2364126 RepID=A0ABN9SFH3_9DINO|nr:unnamed protein product [Polarella glacialis]